MNMKRTLNVEISLQEVRKRKKLTFVVSEGESGETETFSCYPDKMPFWSEKYNDFIKGLGCEIYSWGELMLEEE